MNLTLDSKEGENVDNRPDHIDVDDTRLLSNYSMFGNRCFSISPGSYIRP